MSPLLAALLLGSQSTAPVPGDRWGAFELRTREGKGFAWKLGRTTVLSFCAFWCDTWKDQLPRVREASRITRGLPVDYATVSVDGRWTERAQAEAAGTMLADPGGAWTNRIGIDRVPYTVVISPKGRVLWASSGTVRTDDLVRSVRAGVADKAVAAGRVFLTFDDFPSDRLSHELLDLLRAEGIPATFFCIGAKVEGAANLVRRAAREGHGLGIHSWAHDGEKPELARCAEVLHRITGVSPELYRPPGSERLLTLSGQPVKLPIDNPYDYTRPGVKELTRRTLTAVRPNSVIQLHVGVEETLTALPGILKNLRERGYTFERLSASSAP